MHACSSAAITNHAIKLELTRNLLCKGIVADVPASFLFAAHQTFKPGWFDRQSIDKGNKFANGTARAGARPARRPHPTPEFLLPAVSFAVVDTILQVVVGRCAVALSSGLAQAPRKLSNEVVKTTIG